MSRRTAAWVLGGLLGIVLTAGITWATSKLTSMHIGLSSEPLSAGRSLAPRLPPRKQRTSTATTLTRTATTQTASTQTVTVPTSTTTGAPHTYTYSSTSTAPAQRDDSGGESGEGSGGSGEGKRPARGQKPDD